MGKRVHLPSPGKCTWKCRLLRVNYILVSTKRTKIVHWLEIYLNCNCGLHWGSLQRSPRYSSGTWGIRLAAEKKGQNGEGRGGEEKGWREKEGRRHCPLLQEFPRAPVIQNPPPALPWRDILVSHTKYVQTWIRPSVQFGVRRQLLSTKHDRRFAAGVVSCYIRSATLGICCSQSSVVLTSKSKRRCMGRLLFAVQNFCCLWIKY